MFNERHYVPTLKWKRGEQKALELIPKELKGRMTPVIEILPVPYDFANERPAKTVDDHLKNVVDQIEVSWGNTPIFLDLYWLDESERMSDGKHPLRYLAKQARSREINIIPVIGLERDSQYLIEALRVNSKDMNGICIRLEDDDFTKFSKLKRFISDNSLSPEEIDIIIDLKQIPHGQMQRNLLSAETLIEALPFVKKWRTLTISGSRFPDTLSEVPAESCKPISRSEWKLWKNLYKKRDEMKRIPTFGDYAIASPSFSEIDPRIMQMSANIRYTSDKDWIIFRGRAIRKHGWSQISGMAKELIQHPSYCGKDFSWGDEFIYNCAKELCSTGNAETWRRVGTNHHLTFVVNQLANFFGS